MGTNDLAKELYAEQVPGRAPLLTGLSLALLAARSTGTAILDGVYNDVRDTDGFLAECRQGREMGFDGKTLVHPGQVEGANAAFAPDEQAVDDARGILRPGRTAAVRASSRTRAGWWRPSTSTPPAVRWRSTTRSAPSVVEVRGAPATSLGTTSSGPGGVAARP